MNDYLRQRWHKSTQCLAHSIQCKLLRRMSKFDRPMDSEATNATTSVSNKWIEKVEALYGEPHRAYHNMRHVEDVLASLETLNGPEDASPVLLQLQEVDMELATLAAFFHDAIYDPKSSTNEKDSADLFVEYANELLEAVASTLERTTAADENQQLSTEDFDVRACDAVSNVEQCIVATATHISSANEAANDKSSSNNNPILAPFLDADMSILGRDAERYDAYAGCIRKEYQFVERDVYCQKRAEILDSFLPAAIIVDAEEESADVGMTKGEAVAAETSAGKEKKGHSFIYATKRGRELWEDRARTNLGREIDMLREGVIPCEGEP